MSESTKQSIYAKLAAMTKDELIAEVLKKNREYENLESVVDLKEVATELELQESELLPVNGSCIEVKVDGVELYKEVAEFTQIQNHGKSASELDHHQIVMRIESIIDALRPV